MSIFDTFSTGIVPNKWILDGSNVILSTEKYEDEPQEDPTPDESQEDPTPDDPKEDPATDSSEPISIENAEVALTETTFTYNGKAQKPAIDTIGGRQLTEGTDYKAVWTDESSKKPGTYMVIIVGAGNYTGIAKATYTIKKAANTLKIKAKTATVKFSKLKKKTQTLTVAKVIEFVKKGHGEKKYVLSSAKKGSKSFKKYFKIDKTTGKVTVKKGLKKGTYKVTVKVKAAGNTKFKPSALKAATFKIKVK